MTLAVRQNCSRRVLISKDFIFSILLVHVLHLCTPLWKGLRISFEAMKKAATLWEWKSYSVDQYPNLKTVLETTDSLCKQLRWQEKCIFPELACFTFSSLTPQPSGISALPPTLQSLPPTNMGIVTFTSLTVPSPLHNCSWVTQCPQPQGQRELWPGHCRLCTPEACKQSHPARRRHVLHPKPAPARTPHTYKCTSVTFLWMKPSSKNPLVKFRLIWN